MVDAGSPPSSKVRAANCVLNHAANAIEVEDIEVRVAALERAAETTKFREHSKCGTLTDGSLRWEGLSRNGTSLRQGCRAGSFLATGCELASLH